jgi:putative heme-binding domain-containing protein
MHLSSFRPRGAHAGAFLRLACALAFCGLTRAQEQHPGEYAPADIENGSRLYSAQCATCHGATGDGVGGIDLRRGTFRRGASDADLRRAIAEGVPGTAMRKFDLRPAEQNGIVAYIRAGFDLGARAAKVGDAARGRAVFETKGGCGSCHRVSGVGSRTAPDLTDIGSLRSATMLQQALVDPTGSMLPINRPVRAVTKTGTVITGRRLNDDTYTVQLMDDRERLVSLVKADLQEYQVLTTSPMPPYKDKLSAVEISDLVAYLLSLKG